jgi:hypothetical protein
MCTGNIAAEGERLARASVPCGNKKPAAPFAKAVDGGLDIYPLLGRT